MSDIPRSRVAQALGVAPDALPPGDLPMDRFAARYLDFLRATFETEAFDAHPDYWTDLLLARLMEEAPDTALEAICAVLARVEDMEELELVAAGPLEELLTAQGAALLDALDKRAAQSPRFRLALAALWLEGGGPPLLVARVRAIAADPAMLETDDLPGPEGL
jgi:hypothetical protein